MAGEGTSGFPNGADSWRPTKSKKVQIGDRIGKLQVIEIGSFPRADSHVRRIKALCQCECGNERWVPVCNLLRRPSSQCKSCSARQSATRHGDGRRADRTRLYTIWAGMKARCLTPTATSSANYHARGIEICEEWVESYPAFKKWALDSGYRGDLSIDRIDNDGPYAPWNCRWVTTKVQGRNKRTSHFLTAFGETKTMADWLEDPRCVVSQSLLCYRIRKGLPAESAITVRPGAGKSKAEQGLIREEGYVQPRRKGQGRC